MPVLSLENKDQVKNLQIYILLLSSCFYIPGMLLDLEEIPILETYLYMYL